MGQQQLLLIVLIVIVVFMTLIVSINLWDEEQQKDYTVGGNHNIANEQQKDYEDDGLGTVALYLDEAGDITKALENWRNAFPYKWEKVITLSYFEYDNKGKKRPHFFVIYNSGYQSPQN